MVMHNLVLHAFDRATENLLSETPIPAHLSDAVQQLVGVDEPLWSGGWGIEDDRIDPVLRLLGLSVQADVDKVEWFLSTVA